MTTQPQQYAYPLMAVTGVEIEYAVVDQQTLEVLPVADRLLQKAGLNDDGDVLLGTISWSNELTLHQLEMKTTRPERDLSPIAGALLEQVQNANRMLAPMGGILAPTGMHPWMEPAREVKLWPHANREVYQTFDRIFDCRRHGWGNVQSTQINLSFGNEPEFARLHAAIRLVLPLIPALAASSPVIEGQAGTHLDMRMVHYETNAHTIPAITAQVIPESLSTRAAYQETIFDPIARSLRSVDSEGILHPEWANARGAITRFDRGSIEMRLADTQECPEADMAVIHLLRWAAQFLVDETYASHEQQLRWAIPPLKAILDDTSRLAGQAVITNSDYLRLFGLREPRILAGELWAHLHQTFRRGLTGPDPCERFMAVYQQHGTLARRILTALGPDFSRAALKATYRDLVTGLTVGNLFVP